MYECNKCEEYGLRFHRAYQPVEFIEGKRSSLVWIVGLNPAADQDWVDHRTSVDLQSHFDDHSKMHGYFKDFKVISADLFEKFGKEFGTAHTDIVKCSSRSFPPESAKGKKAARVISNCLGYLKEQIRQHKPKLIVCNGAEVSKFMLEFLPPPDNYKKTETSYWSSIDGAQICIVLSGFVGRIDNYAKRRLGIEIEARLSQI